MRFVLLFLLSLPVYANFSGKFSGTGRAVFSTGRVYECREIFLDLENTNEKFSLHEGGYRCGDLLHASYDPFFLTIRNGKLFHQETELGSISNKKLTYTIIDLSDGSTFRLTLQKNEENQIHYLEEWHDGEKIALTIKGTLKSLNY